MRFGVVKIGRIRPGCVEHELPMPVVEASTIEVSEELQLLSFESKINLAKPSRTSRRSLSSRDIGRQRSGTHTCLLAYSRLEVVDHR